MSSNISIPIFSLNRLIKYLIAATAFHLFLFACNPTDESPKRDTLFELLPPEKTGVDFVNKLYYLEDFNIFTYRNFYNGGGVAIGDVNNDGLPDIYFTSNMEANKLYQNQGNFQFTDITKKAGVAGKRKWSTAVAMVDVNGDGWLDIYVCNSGNIKGDDRKNELFINNQDGTFTESAVQYGLDDNGFSSQASFFDYDRDGDLDVYLVNNSFQSMNSKSYQNTDRSSRDPLGGDKLLNNDNGVFKDVSKEANIWGSLIGFGLGAITTDLNRDGWLDIYVCNDFFERDYIYMNNGDGTFNEELPSQMQSINQASMGVDAADINGDGYPEIFVTEMLPKSDDRFKTTMLYEDWDTYTANLEKGYYHQFTRNTLQLNNQEIVPGNISFSEIGRLCGVEATDWSWSGLIVDLDLNGHRDIFVTNGIYQDILDQHFLKKISNDLLFRDAISNQSVNYKKLIDAIPSTPISNFAFAANQNFQFGDSTISWGFDKAGFSNGAAYGDLDNDGDLDLVVNNVEMAPFIYKNKTTEKYPDHHYLKVKLTARERNPFAIGAKVQVFSQGRIHVAEQITSRGFQSSMDPNIIIGLGRLGKVDSLKVFWPSGNLSIVNDVRPDELLEINEYSSSLSFNGTDEKKQIHRLFKEVTTPSILLISHNESQFNDFENASLLFHMSSTEGAGIAIADVNDDGLEDIYLCGAKGFPGKLFLQTNTGDFQPNEQEALGFDKFNEDINAVFLDADGDDDMDLLVTSGSPEYLPFSARLMDRLYVNDGNGTFQKASFLSSDIPPENTSAVQPCDFDKDGDLDLFIGIRSESDQYGLPQNGYILENDGHGYFTNITSKVCTGLGKIGMITDAKWMDYDNDGWQDLVVVGDWMPIRLFKNEGGEKLRDISETTGLSSFKGWWNCVEIADLDNDGDLDIVAGNHGLNSRFKVSKDQSLTMFVKDFDNNGVIEQIIGRKLSDENIPYAQVEDLLKQIPSLKGKFDDLKTMAFTLEDLYSQKELDEARKLEVNHLSSSVFINNSKSFTKFDLPIEAQTSPIYAMMIKDINGDGHADILAGGNLYEVKPEVGRYDASYGHYLEGLGNGRFKAVPNAESGLNIIGQVRDIKPLNIKDEPYFIFTVIDGPAKIYRWKRSSY